MCDRGAPWSYLKCEFLFGWTMAKWQTQGQRRLQWQQQLWSKDDEAKSQPEYFNMLGIGGTQKMCMKN